MMKRNILAAVLFLVFTCCTLASADSYAFNGANDNERDDLGYYYAITGGLFPTGTTPNGNNGSGGTFRFLTDDPTSGYPIDVWRKDDWFPDNAGIALTLQNNGATVYTNCGIEDGTYGSYYDGTGVALSEDVHGLYRGYSMSNNWDWIYAGYFKLEEQTTIDTLIGYFDETLGFDRNNPIFTYRMNIWSNVDGDLLPVNTGGFTGDVFASDTTSGVFSTSDTGVDRIYGDDRGNVTDDIFRLTYKLDTPLTLDPGVYWFSHDAAIVPLPGAVLLGMLGLGVAGAKLRKRA